MSASESARDILEGREVIVEITIVGDYARACAIDAETGVEAIAIAPASAARSDMERLATGKLARILRARAQTAGRKDPPSGDFSI